MTAHLLFWASGYTLALLVAHHAGRGALQEASGGARFSWPALSVLVGLSSLALRAVAFGLGRGYTGGRPGYGGEGAVQAAALSVAAALAGALGLRFAGLPGFPPWLAVLDGVLGLGLLLTASAIAALVDESAQRRASRRGASPRRVVLVGRLLPLYQTLWGQLPAARFPSLRSADSDGETGVGERGDEQVVGVLVEGWGDPGRRLMRVPVIDELHLARALARGGVDRVLIVPPVSDSLARWIARRCTAAGVGYLWLDGQGKEARGGLWPFDRAPGESGQERVSGVANHVVEGG